MTTIATLFSGGEGVGIGGKLAGLQHIWGIEYDDEIAQVARENGFAVVTADVTAVDPSRFERPDVLHASPPCPNFSIAKMGATESEEDVELARATVRFIEELLPRFFTLENVWMYQRSESWRLIEDTLNRLGYWTSLRHLNTADFGVPQTRKRMIVRAIRGGWLPALPQPEPWRGWHQAVEDLLPFLPDSQFAPWQLERGVQDRLDQSYLLAQGSFNHTDEGNERDAQEISRRRVTEPAFAVTANDSMLGMRAFLATGQYGQPAGTPGRVCQMVDENDPSPTVTASAKGDWRAAIPGRVVRISPRCLARFQSVPDDYLLPAKATLAVRIVGNMVPPLMMQRLLEPFA